MMTTKQTAEDLLNLPKETLLTAIDDEENEYVISEIVRRKTYGDNEKDWYYAFKLKPTGTGCIKR